MKIHPHQFMTITFLNTNEYPNNFRQMCRVCTGGITYSSPLIAVLFSAISATQGQLRCENIRCEISEMNDFYVLKRTAVLSSVMKSRVVSLAIALWSVAQLPS